jgi:predicted phage tail protein
MSDQTQALLVQVKDPFNAFKSRELARVEIGRTIFEVLTEQNYISMTSSGVKRHGYFIVTLNGEAVMQADWNTVIRDEDCLGIWALPQGGGGGSNIGAIIITVVMVAAAVFTGGATLGVALAWGAAAGAGVGLLSSLTPTAAIPKTGSSIGKDVASSTYTISAQNNSVRVGESIPVQYGRMRVFPDLAAQPYTETRGNAMYLYQLMCLGQGKFEVEKIQIEDSNINAYGEIEYEIIQPGGAVTLFPDNVITSEAVQGLEMLAPDEENYAVLGPYVVCPPGVKVTYIAVDVQMPQGAYTVDDNGNNRTRSVHFQFSATPIDDAGNNTGATFEIVNETLSFSTKTPQMLSYKVEVPEGRYTVQGTRNTPKAPDNRTIDKLIWTGLKGYAHSATDYGNVTMLAVIIKATNNLNSNTSRRINTIQTRMLPTWDAVNGWGAEVATANPAWAYADALRNADYGPAWGTNRINMSELYRLAQVWQARGDEFNGVYDNRSTLWEALSQIASVGRASPQYYAGMMDIIRDEPKSIPAQIFSPGQVLQNTFKGSYKLGTSQTPDHVIVKFWNRETWQEDQVTCVLPGSTTKVPYTKDMTYGITDHDHAWREGMYAAAVNRDQRSRNSFTTEMEGLLLRFGDLIHVTHDVPGWGAPGKVISFNPLTGKVVTTEPLVFTAGVTHYITFRRKNGKADGPWPVVADPNATPGVNSAIVQGSVANRQEIYISPGVSTDLTTYAFGPADRESNKMVVLSAKPNSRGETQITVCDYVTSTHVADQGGDVPIPPPISNLPGPPVGPIVNTVRVELTTTVGLQQIVADPAVGATYYEFQGRVQGGGNWSSFGVSGDPFLFVNLDAGLWDIRVRGIGAIPGPWATWSGNIEATSLPLPKLSLLSATTDKLFAIDVSVDYAEETRSISKTLELWVSRTADIGNATLLVKLPYPASSYTHTSKLIGDRWYYFGRVIDTGGRVGPWYNNGLGIFGTTSDDPTEILKLLDGEITASQLGDLLLSEIEKISGDGPGSVNERYKAGDSVLQGQIDSLSAQLADLAGAPDWEADQAYLAGALVKSNGKLYKAKIDTPAGTPVTNTTYWEYLGDYSSLGDLVTALAVRMDAVETEITEIDGELTAMASRLIGVETAVAPRMAGATNWRAGETGSYAGAWSVYAAFSQGDMAIAKTVNEVKAQVDNNLARVVTEVEAMADDLSALATTTTELTAQVNTNKTNIQTVNQALVDETQTRAQQVSTLTTEQNNIKASVQTNAQSIQDTNGRLAVTYNIKLGIDVNGRYYAAGMGIGIENTPSGMQSTVVFLADRFAVMQNINGTPQSVFAIESGQTVIAASFISKLTVRNAIVGSYIQSSEQSNWGTPIMGQDFVGGQITTYHPTMANTYTVMNRNGITVVINGVVRVRMGTW